MHSSNTSSGTHIERNKERKEESNAAKFGTEKSGHKLLEYK
jgi:hypothetical protein